MFTVDDGRRALAELQTVLLRDRALAFNGADVQVLYEQSLEKLISELWHLDSYLTGKTEGRNFEMDQRGFWSLYMEGKLYHIHLSDGGYSRLTVNLEEGNPVVMDLGLSLERPKARWAALFPPS